MNSKHTLAVVFIAALLMLTSAILPAAAQSDSGPTVVNRAITALNQSFPGIGQPDNFNYTFSTATTDSTLGCPLIDGFEMSSAVIPYRVTLDYGSAQYVYHASSDGSILLPCDPDLPIGGATGGPDRAAFTPNTPAEAAIMNFMAANPQRGFPDSFTFSFGDDASDIACGNGANLPYVVTLTEGTSQFFYRVSSDSRTVVAC